MISQLKFYVGVCCLMMTLTEYVSAQENFFQNKKINLIVGYSPGGSNDLYARLLARFLPRHLAGNPTVIVTNMPGAGSIRAADYIYGIAPKDGTVIGTVSRGIAFDPLFGLPSGKFEATKFSWIGSANEEVSVCVSWETSQIKVFDDLLKSELVVGSLGGGSDSDLFPKVMNAVLGTKFKVVPGYPGGNELNLAIERHELEGRCGWSWAALKSTHRPWLEAKKVHVLIQLALNKHSDLPSVPSVMDYAKSDEDRQVLKLIFARQVIGRPFLAPPGMPQARLQELRVAFWQTLNDQNFLQEAERQELEITPVKGEDVENLIKETYKMSSDVISKAAAVLKK